MNDPLEEASLSIGLVLVLIVDGIVQYGRVNANKLEGAKNLGTFDIFDG